MSKNYENFVVENELLSVFFENDKSANWKLIHPKDEKFIKNDFLINEVYKLVDRHNRIIERMENAGKREFNKLEKKANDLHVEVDAKLLVINCILDASEVA